MLRLLYSDTLSFTDLQPHFCHCHSWAAKALTVLFKIEGSQGTSPFSCSVEKDKILTTHGQWIAVVLILRVIRLPRNPTAALPDSHLPQQICGETRKHIAESYDKKNKKPTKETKTKGTGSN